MDNDKNVYELGYLLAPIIPEEKLPEEAASIRSAMDNLGGSLVSEEMPKLKKLAYEITHSVAGGKNAKYSDGNFGWMRFYLSPEKVAEFEAEIKKNDKVFRYLLINLAKDNGSALKNDARPGKNSIRKAPKAASEKEIDKEIDNLLAKSDSASS